MSSRVMNKFNALIEKGEQIEREGEINPNLDLVWFSLLVAQSETIVLLEDIRKMVSEHRPGRFNQIDLSNES